MENASKALIIAGAILLSILIIALGIYVFNMAKGATNTDALDEMEVSQFNQLFTQYDGRIIGTQVTSLLDKLVTGASKNAGADDRLPDLYYLETRKAGGLNEVAVEVERGNGDNNKWSQVAKGDGSITLSGDGSKKDKERLDASGLTYTSGVYGIYKIESDSEFNEMKAFSNFRSKIVARHYYQVGHSVDNDTGLIDAVYVKY